ncbi:PHD zinc finger-containing putative transcriptional regulator [Encephalitozoon romaleae SJ-2008]|uniref:PHD zinc finger-containing putative transcriptional regulator n=1 Tax=Encephalitozoon romaleae (strain SJ-2008) TaxID=1178016 RepID=I6ZKI3_ENCRO|nr:PHD zinc finger-containing putative transcriptional regulator [Encephalitozoon romaleae SJ-2008]AFN83803.1 PHD zinc finger-containing putative transcriptional regulator [Encephalitozoon romaleae SJ-2008]
MLTCRGKKFSIPYGESYHPKMSTSQSFGSIPREERSYKSIYDGIDLLRMHHIVADGIHPPEEKLKKKQTIQEEQGKDFFESILYKVDSYDRHYLHGSHPNVSENVFELIMDRLEKEWFFFVQGLVTRYVKPLRPSSFCDICTKYTSENDKALVVCQGCEICVHENCYGIQDLSDFWLCRRCIYREDSKECSFCISTNGVFKQTSDNKWGHVLCVMFNRSLSFGHPLSKEPIDVGSYTKESGCLFCDEVRGTVICCSYFACSKKYHVPCALDKCYFDLSNRLSYCIVHSPLKENTCELGHRKISAMKRFGYEKLSHPPIIRKKVPMACPKPTLFSKLSNLQPIATPSIIWRIKTYDLKGKYGKDMLKILKYWELKRRTVGEPLVVHPDILPGRWAEESWINKRKE